MAERGAWFQSAQLNTSYTTTNPQCSCPRCDSMQCFSRRQVNAACSCPKCNNSKTCLSFPQKMDATKDDERTTVVKTPMEGDDITAKEQVKREITYEHPENGKTQSKVKILKKTMFSGDKESREIENSDFSEHPIDIPIENEAVNISGKERSSSAAKLSAQVMNIPYQDMLEDISNKQSHSSYKISAYDVLKRIRDAYKACSCKVCECLVGKSLAPKNELCKCEPCDCNDCMSYLTKFQYLGRYEKQVPEGCPCVRCDRSQCKALNKNNPQSCDCRRNSCVESSTSFAKSCECQSCQCIECKGMSFGVPRTLVIAPVGEQHQHVYCQCTPCECIECRGYGIASGFARETATSVNRHPRCHCEMCTNEACIPDGSESCRCERHSKVVKKPIAKDVRDYDIHAMVTSDKVIRNTKNKPVKNSMIALYATVPNTYKKKGYKKECSCTICECVVCNCKENAVDSIKSSQLFQETCKKLNTPNFISGACKCSPCECETLCSKKGEEIKIMAKNCKCDICSCLNCVGIRNVDIIKTCPYVNAIKVQSNQQFCKCGPCECVDCNKNNTCSGDECKCAICSCEQCDHESKESIYPIKKAQVFTPSTYTHEVLKEVNTHRYHISGEDYCKNATDVKLYDSSKEISQRDIFSYHAHPHNYRRIEKMEYILPPGKKAPLHPKTDNGDFKTKARIVSHGNTGIKYSTHNDSRNMYRRNCDNDNVQSPSILSADSLSINLADSSGYSTVSPALVEGDLCENSCDSGCGSLDYYTIVPESTVKSSKVDEQYSKDQNAKYMMSLENKSDILTVLTEKDYINENQGRHHHSFESDSQNYTNRDDNYCSTSQSGIFNGNITANERIYDQKFWIKNVDVSLKLHELDFNKDKQKYLDNVSKNNSTNDGNLQNTAEDSDVSLPISRNFGDYSLNSRDQRGEDSFNNEGYYEGVQKTLHRARAFSLQLMKILDKYERANNEFQSITQKLKLSHASLINKNELNEHENNVRKSSLVQRLSEREFPHKKHKYYNNAKEETLTRPNIFEDLQSKTTKDQLTQVDKSLIIPKLLYYQNTCLLDMEKIRRLEEFYNIFKEKDSKKSLNGLLTLSERKIGGLKKSNKLSPKILKQLIILSKGSHRNIVTSPILKSDRITQTSHLIQNKEETAVHLSNFSRDDAERLDSTDTRCLDLILPILKKNYYLNKNPVTRNKGICIFPTIQRDVKQVVRSISMQTTTIGKGYLPHKNVALLNLKTEVLNLLNTPVLQHSPITNNFDFNTRITSQTQTKMEVLMASECQTNKENDYMEDLKYKPVNCKSSKSCCDALKVNFLSLRRVSDHTVLVKWNVPRETTDVAGYELLVDGRAVQKILSPLRCVAVVTCLPHCETILLTIRTITSLTPSGHYPSSTVVYHPRAKEQ